MAQSGDPIHFDPGSNEPSSVSSGLLAGLRARDEAQWQRMSVIFAPLVLRWCLAAGARNDDAPDIVQEVFRTVAARIGQFRRDRPQDTFRGWLWTITRNKLGDYFRKLNNEPQAAGGSSVLRHLQNVAEPDPSAIDEASASGLSSACHRALGLIRAEFEDVTWQAFWRAAVEGHVPADIAADLGITVNSVYLAKSRILRRLREELGEGGALEQS